MSNEKYSAQWASLAKALEVCGRVRRVDSPDEPGSWATAHGLLDIEEALAAFAEKLKRLKSEVLDDQQVADVLLDIGEDLRHVMYHVDDMKFYQYLKKQSE